MAGKRKIPAEPDGVQKIKVESEAGLPFPKRVFRRVKSPDTDEPPGETTLDEVSVVIVKPETGDIGCDSPPIADDKKVLEDNTTTERGDGHDGETHVTDGDPQSAAGALILRPRLVVDRIPSLSIAEVITAVEDRRGTDGDDEDERPKTSSFVDTSGLAQDLVDRIHAMRLECNPATGTFYITKVPMDLRFGVKEAFDMRNFLVRAKNYPIKIYVCGRLVALSLFDSEGAPVNRPWVSIRPLCEDDSVAAAEIINNYSLPVQHTTHHSYRTIIAGRFQQIFGCAPGTPAKRLNTVFLATSGIRERIRYDAAKLQKRDLVVLELRVRKRADPGEPTHHTVTFQMQAVNVLEISDGHVPADEKEEEGEVAW